MKLAPPSVVMVRASAPALAVNVNFRSGDHLIVCEKDTPINLLSSLLPPKVSADLPPLAQGVK